MSNIKRKVGKAHLGQYGKNTIKPKGALILTNFALHFKN